MIGQKNTTGLGLFPALVSKNPLWQINFSLKACHRGLVLAESADSDKACPIRPSHQSLSLLVDRATAF